MRSFVFIIGEVTFICGGGGYLLLFGEDFFYYIFETTSMMETDEGRKLVETNKWKYNDVSNK